MDTTPTRREDDDRLAADLPWTPERVDAQRKRLIQGAVHGTAIRGSKGNTVAACRELLTLEDLGEFRDSALVDFEGAHCQLVRRLQAELTQRGCSDEFGRAAKVTDLALRDLVQNHHTRTFYRLQCLDPLLHLPVDSQVDRRLREEVGPDERLPKPWPGIKGLGEREYGAYQAVALELARRRGITRIELDNVFWSRSPPGLARSG